MTAVDDRLNAPSTHARMRDNPWWTLVSVSFGIMMVGVDATVVAIANPFIGRSLHASLADLQWITNSYLLVLAVLLIVGGRLGDRYGRRLIFMIGVIGFGLASVGVGVADSITGAIILRGLQGAFGALLLPNTLALLRVAFPEDRLNSAIGIWSSTSALATAGAPIVGGLLVEHVSWQSVFYLNVPVGLLTCGIGAFALRESRESVRQPVDTPGVILLSISLFAIVFAIVKAQTWGWGDPSTFCLLGGGLVIMALFVWVELRAAAPLVPPRFFRIRSVSLGSTTVILSFFALFAVLFFVSLYLQNVEGFSAVSTGTRTLGLTLAFAVTSIRAARITTRFGPGLTITFGLLLVAGALFGMTALDIHSSFFVLLPSLVCLGVGLGLVVVASAEAIVGSVPVDDSGLAGGLQATAAQLGGVLGASVLGSVVALRAASALPAKLAAAGVAPALAHRALAKAALVGQGLSVSKSPAVTQASHAAFISGFHLALVIGAVVALLGAATGPFIPRNEQAPIVPVHI
jgi:EmrB/QacA subfamily drug resistance transporter